MRLLPPLRPAVRRAFLIDLRSGVPFGLFAGMVVPFLGVTARRLGASPFEVSLVVAGPAVGSLFAAWWSAAISRANPVPFVVWPAAVARALFLLAPLARGPAAFVALVLAFQVIHNLSGPAYAATARAVFPSRLRGTLIGLIRIGASLAMVLGSLAAGPLLQRFGHQVVFPIAAFFGIASAVLFGAMRVPAAAPPDAVRPPLHEAWRVSLADARFRRLLAVASVFGFGAWMMAPAIPILLVDVLAAGSAQVGVLSAATSTALIVGFYGWGRLIDRRSGRTAMRLAMSLAVLTPLLLLAAPSVWFVLLPFAIDGLVSAALDLAWLAATIELAPAHRVGQYAGAYLSLVGVRGVIAPLAAGLILQAVGPRPVFALAAAITGLGAVLGRLWLRDAPGAPAPAAVPGAAARGPAR